MSPLRAEFRVRERDLAGRVGELRLRRGSIETPYMFPVIDVARQELPVEEVASLGFNAVITNAYLLLKRGFLGKLSELFGSGAIVMTDSGAYQLLKYGSIDVDNATIVKYQQGIESDIAVILDYPTGDSLDREFAWTTVRETLRRAEEAYPLIRDDDRAWVLPIQGGVHLDILDYSALKSATLDYDIYALGSPTVMMESYCYEVVASMIVTVRRRLQSSRPLHLFGGGHPMFIPFAVALGADLFDSASYILFARDNRYMTEGGTKKLEELEYLPCSCPVCYRRDPQDLLEVPERERVALLAKHNLCVIASTLRRTKQAIVEGRLWDLLEDLGRSHPSLHSLLAYVSEKHWAYLERRSPAYPRKPSSPFAFDELSTFNPAVGRSATFTLRRYEPPPHKKSLVLRPRLSYTISDEGAAMSPEEHLVFYDHIMVLPLELSRVHPEGHIAVSRAYIYNKGLMKKALSNAIGYAKRWMEFYERIVLEVCYEWLDLALTEIRKASRGGKVFVRPRLCHSLW